MHEAGRPAGVSRSAPDPLAGRRVRLGAVVNFRDLGGYPSRLGGATRWGVLYRSDGLHQLAAADRARFETLGVVSVLDLRRADEVALEPGIAGAEHVPVPSHRPTDAVGPGSTRAEGEGWLRDEYLFMLAEGVLSSPRWAMAEALEALDWDHGGIEAYLSGPGRVDPATVAALRTELLA